MPIFGTWPWLVLAGIASGVIWKIVSDRRDAVPAGTGPIVVFFHGKLARDATYEAILDPLGVDYVLPHGRRVVGDRYEWWPMSSTTEDQAEYAQDVDEAAMSVTPTIQKLKATGRPLLLAGHSQGGQLAATLAMRGVAPAVVASAWVPELLRSSTPSPIVFVHGTEDPYAPFERTQQMVTELDDAGADVGMVRVDGAGHTFTGPLLQAWTAELQEVLES